MPSPISEARGLVFLSDHPSDWSPGIYRSWTVPMDVSSPTVVHTGLTRVAATVEPPATALIGISSYSTPDGPWFAEDMDGFLPFVAHRELLECTVSAYVKKGDMTGWWYWQKWR